jgi:hypothetical protein
MAVHRMYYGVEKSTGKVFRFCDGNVRDAWVALGGSDRLVVVWGSVRKLRGKKPLWKSAVGGGQVCITTVSTEIITRTLVHSGTE